HQRVRAAGGAAVGAGHRDRREVVTRGGLSARVEVAGERRELVAAVQVELVAHGHPAVWGEAGRPRGDVPVVERDPVAPIEIQDLQAVRLGQPHHGLAHGPPPLTLASVRGTPTVGRWVTLPGIASASSPAVSATTAATPYARV